MFGVMRVLASFPGPAPGALWVALAGLIFAGYADAQEAEGPSRTVVTVAGPEYSAGPFHQLVLGRHYRHLWLEPIEVEVLDLDRFAGGLRPLRVGGGRQTKSLKFLGADGREYSFRSVDKDPSPVLDSILRETFIDDLVQDGISAAHPLGALVAAPLLAAVGVLHVTPKLRVMPDDPALGEFREEFAGMLGLIEEEADENERGTTAFRGAVRITGSEAFTERLRESPKNRVDARAFLAARLMDVFLGDWDRHRGQWRWATYQPRDEDLRIWLPVPSDRDQAFSKFDGIAPRLVSLYMPQFVRFEEEYPAIWRLHWNGRALDRWLLAGLERPVWDSIGASLQDRLSDEVIREAVGRLPPEIYALNASELTSTLLARRDRLDEAWDAFYRILAREVDVHATDADEVVEVERGESGGIRVRITAPEHGDHAYLSRTFDPEETGEVRVYMRGGDDRVAVEEGADGAMALRFIGGPGDDVFAVGGTAEGIHLYDAEDDNEVLGPATLDRRPFDAWVWSEEDRDQPRDWGRRTTPIFWSTYSSDLGPFIGGGARLESYGFRKSPYASAIAARGGYSLSAAKGRLEIESRTHRANSPLFVEIFTRYSGLDVINYYGVGNNSRALGDEFRKVDHRSATLRSSLGLAVADGLTLTGGIVLSWSDTDENEGRYFAEVRDSIYGALEFAKLGAAGRMTYDPLKDSEVTAHRFRVSLGGAVYPGGVMDVERSFATADARFSGLLASSFYPRLSLALRGGGKIVWGRFPWADAAFLGGDSTLRGWDEQRFAGDAAAYISGELRLRLGRPRVVVPVSMGVFAFSDIGRVYVDGESPGSWHTGVGGGVWLQPAGHSYMLRWGLGTSDEGEKVYLALGLPY